MNMPAEQISGKDATTLRNAGLPYLTFVISLAAASAITALLFFLSPEYVSCEAELVSHADGGGIVAVKLSGADGSTSSGKALIDSESDRVQRISMRLRKPRGNDATAEIRLGASTGSLTVRRLTIGGKEACLRERADSGSGEPAGSGKCPPAELSVSGEQARGTFSMPPDAESGRELYPGIAFSLIVILTSVLMSILPAAAAYLRRTAAKDLARCAFSAAVVLAVGVELLVYIDCTASFSFPVISLITEGGAFFLVIRNGKRAAAITRNLLFITAAASICVIAAMMTNSALRSDDNIRKMLAEMPEPVLQDGRINQDFDTEYETWLTEHSELRESAASLLFLPQHANIAARGRNPDSYIAHEYAFSAWDDTYSPDEEKIRTISRNMEKAQRHWGIPMLVIVYPAKPEIMCGKTLLLRCAENSRIQTRLLRKYTEGSGIRIVNAAPEIGRLRDTLPDYPENELFFNDEHHMTQTSQDMLADWLVREKLIPPSVSSMERYRTLEKCSSGELIFRKDEGTCPLYGQSYGAITGFDSRNQESALLEPRLHPYLSLSPEYNSDISRKDTAGIFTVLTNSRSDASPHTLMVIGNSFAESLSIALASRYSRVIRYRSTTNLSPIGLYHFDRQIQNEKPELIIVTMFQDRPFLTMSGMDPDERLLKEKRGRESREK